MKIIQDMLKRQIEQKKIREDVIRSLDWEGMRKAGRDVSIRCEYIPSEIIGGVETFASNKTKASKYLGGFRKYDAETPECTSERLVATCRDAIEYGKGHGMRIVRMQVVYGMKKELIYEDVDAVNTLYTEDLKTWYLSKTEHDRARLVAE